MRDSRPSRALRHRSNHAVAKLPLCPSRALGRGTAAADLVPRSRGAALESERASTECARFSEKPRHLNTQRYMMEWLDPALLPIGARQESAFRTALLNR